MQTGSPVPSPELPAAAAKAAPYDSARLALAVQAAELGIWDWDLATDTMVYSDRAREICGFPPAPAPITHADAVRVTHPEDLPRTTELARRALDPAIRERVPYRYRIIRPDGEVRWVLAHGEALFEHVDGTEQPVRYVGTLQDVTERHRLVQALELSESRLRLAVEGGRLAVWEADLPTETMVGSPALNRLLGFPEDATPTPQDIRAGYPPGEHERIRALWDSALARGERFLEMEYRYRWPTGELRWLLLRAEVQLQGDQPVKAVGVLVDITERQRAQHDLRASEARLKLAQKAANIGVWDWEPGSGAISWSPEMYTLFGLDPVADAADPHGAWLGVLHPDDRAMADDLARRSAEQGASFSHDFRVRRGDTGEIRWIRAHGTAMQGSDGRPLHVIGVDLDVTDLHRQQEALQERNRALQELADRSRRERERVFEISHDLIAVAGLDGFLRATNPAWGRVLGYDEATLRARPFMELLHSGDVGAARCALDALRRGHYTPRFEVRMRRVDGSWRWIAWNAVIEGEVLYAVGRDVTHQRRAAEELQDAYRSLRTQIEERARMEQTLQQMQRLEAVGRLTAGVSHDFNNLLTVILGNIDVIDRASDDAKLRQRLVFMRQAALRGAALTSQLQAFSRRQRLEPKPVDLNAIVDGMGALLKSTLGGSVQMEIVPGSGLWNALADPTQLELVILNLAINARDAMPAGGRLALGTANSTVSQSPRQPGEPVPGDYVTITVSDTGSGMSEEVRARAFEPFFTTKEVGKGSGLGLAQVLGFVQQSGGGVGIDSRPGGGTTVRVYLPRAADVAVAPDAPSAQAEPAPPHKASPRILLVDDEHAVREVIAAKLRGFGLDVLEANSGPAALDQLARHPDVQLLVADFAMPGMNGAEVARRARASRPDLPVLFVTGYADPAELAEVGVEGVVQKPFRDEELQRKVLAALAPRMGGATA